MIWIENNVCLNCKNYFVWLYRYFVISKTQSMKLIGVLRPKKPTKCQRRKDKKQQNHPLWHQREGREENKSWHETENSEEKDSWTRHFKLLTAI